MVVRGLNLRGKIDFVTMMKMRLSASKKFNDITPL